MPLEAPLQLCTTVVGLHSRGSGLLMTTEGTLTGADGEVYATTTEGTFLRMEGGSGEKLSVGRALASPAIPTTPPTATRRLATSRDQALMFRLSGDYNPLHADPQLAKVGGPPCSPPPPPPPPLPAQSPPIDASWTITIATAAGTTAVRHRHGHQRWYCCLHCAFTPPVPPAPRLLPSTFDQMVGFERPILHGLCTLGFATRHVVAQACPGESERLLRVGGRFSSPCVPGEVLETQIWYVDERGQVVECGGGSSCAVCPVCRGGAGAGAPGSSAGLCVCSARGSGGGCGGGGDLHVQFRTRVKRGEKYTVVIDRGFAVIAAAPAGSTARARL